MLHLGSVSPVARFSVVVAKVEGISLPFLVNHIHPSVHLTHNQITSRFGVPPTFTLSNLERLTGII